MLISSSGNRCQSNAQPRFGAYYTVDETGAKSKYYQPWVSVNTENGDVFSIGNLSVHDKRPDARVLNTTIVPVGNQTKNRVATLLVIATVCLGIGTLLVPPLSIATLCCGVGALVVFLSKGLAG